MMRNFFVRQNQGSWIAVSRPESGINVCRKWDGFRQVGEPAKGRTGVVPSCRLVVWAHCDGER
jgi:hypothetical protein